MKSIYLFVFTVLLSFTFLPVPFARSDKEMPSGTWAENIPSYVGDYKRVAFQTPSGISNGIAVYKKGTMLFQLAFKTLASETTLQHTMEIAKSHPLSKRGDLKKVNTEGAEKYVFYAKGSRHYFAWNRGLNYFEVTGNNGKDEMESFMRAFPY